MQITDDKLNFRLDEARNSKEMRETHSRMGRLGEPIEMAKIMAFMVSDDNAYMSGSEIISDGGVGAMPWKMKDYSERKQTTNLCKKGWVNLLLRPEAARRRDHATLLSDVDTKWIAWSSHALMQ